jgi:hypothetical protein
MNETLPQPMSFRRRCRRSPIEIQCISDATLVFGPKRLRLSRSEFRRGRAYRHPTMACHRVTLALARERRGLFFRNGLAHAMRGRLVARAPLAVKCTSRRNGNSVHASFITVNVDYWKSEYP